MAQEPVAKLYTPALLSLATQLADYPLSGDFAYRAEARSRTCGSTIALGVDLDADGQVKKLGLQVSACAIGQSSAALLAKAAIGRTAEEFAAVQASIEAWLDGASPDTQALPEWPGFEALAPAWPHKGRHGALLLAWTAMTQALSSEPSSR